MIWSFPNAMIAECGAGNCTSLVVILSRVHGAVGRRLLAIVFMRMIRGGTREGTDLIFNSALRFSVNNKNRPLFFILEQVEEQTLSVLPSPADQIGRGFFVPTNHR